MTCVPSEAEPRFNGRLETPCRPCSRRSSLARCVSSSWTDRFRLGYLGCYRRTAPQLLRLNRPAECRADFARWRETTLRIQARDKAMQLDGALNRSGRRAPVLIDRTPRGPRVT